VVTTIAKPQTISLEEFLALPETKPASEYAQGLITQKVIPKGKHSILQFELASAIN
jgi:Uma2 family endonuclease